MIQMPAVQPGFAIVKQIQNHPHGFRLDVDNDFTMDKVKVKYDE
jgi:hypothetical protein